MRTDNTRNAKIKGDQIEVFKILYGYEHIDSKIVFEIKESKITRGHNYTLVKKQSRLDVRRYSFSQRTINAWNNLSTDCVHAIVLILGGCPFNGPLSVMKYPTRESPRRDAASPIKYNGLRVPQPSSLAEQQPVGR